jgi:hypothetical protein
MTSPHIDPRGVAAAPSRSNGGNGADGETLPAPGVTAAPRLHAPPGGYGDEVIERVRQLVVGTTMPLTAIAAAIGISPAAVRKWIGRYGWVRPEGAPVIPGRPAMDLERRRSLLAVRLYQAVSRQLSGLEVRARGRNHELDEKDARMLGVLARTLTTLAELDEDGGAARPDPDGVDPDQIRARLAQRLYALGKSEG